MRTAGPVMVPATLSSGSPAGSVGAQPPCHPLIAYLLLTICERERNPCTLLLARTLGIGSYLC